MMLPTWGSGQGRAVSYLSAVIILLLGRYLHLQIGEHACKYMKMISWWCGSEAQALAHQRLAANPSEVASTASRQAAGLRTRLRALGIMVRNKNADPGHPYAGEAAACGIVDSRRIVGICSCIWNLGVAERYRRLIRHGTAQHSVRTHGSVRTAARGLTTGQPIGLSAGVGSGGAKASWASPGLGQ